MPISPKWKDEVMEKLSAVGMIRAKAMFGGLGFYRDDHFFAVADDDVLFFKTDEVNKIDYISRGMEAFDPMGTGKPMKYHRLPPGILDEPKALSVWVDKACAAAERKGKGGGRKK